MPDAPILIVSGTNRPGANAMRIAGRLQNHYETLGVPTQLRSLIDLPPEIFRPESYATKPPAFAEWQEAVLSAAGLHLVVPEYNGGFPGVLKVFIDHLKVPDSFQHRPVALVGEANGRFGALRAIEQLQMVFGYRNAHVFPERVFIPNVKSAFAADGTLDPEIDGRLKKQCENFASFIQVLAR